MSTLRLNMEAAQLTKSNKSKALMGEIYFDPGRSLALLDEAPQAYKNISAVMSAQNELVSIIREVKPVLSYKG